MINKYNKINRNKNYTNNNIKLFMSIALVMDALYFQL